MLIGSAGPGGAAPGRGVRRCGEADLVENRAAGLSPAPAGHGAPDREHPTPPAADRWTRFPGSGPAGMSRARGAPARPAPAPGRGFFEDTSPAPAQLLAGQLPAAAAGPGRSPLPSELLPPRPRRNPFVAASPVPRCSSSSDSRGSGHPSRTTPFIAASPVPRRGRFYCRLALPFSAPLRSTFTHASPFPARRGF